MVTDGRTKWIFWGRTDLAFPSTSRVTEHQPWCCKLAGGPPGYPCLAMGTVSVPLLLSPGHGSYVCSSWSSIGHSLSTHYEPEVSEYVWYSSEQNRERCLLSLRDTSNYDASTHAITCHNCSPLAKMPEGWDELVRLTTRGQCTLQAYPEPIQPSAMCLRQLQLRPWRILPSVEPTAEYLALI